MSKSIRSFSFILLSHLLLISLLQSQNFWEQTSGPHGSRIQSIDQSSNGNLYIVCDSTLSSRIYRSTDKGFNWSQIKSTPNVWNLILNKNDEIFLASDNGIYRSSDNGNTWIDLSSQLPHRQTLDIGFGINGYLYAGSTIGIARSTDDGLTWIDISDDLYKDEFGFISVRKIFINRRGTIYALKSWPYTMFYSTNSGDNWSPLKIKSANDTIVLMKISPQGVLIVEDKKGNLFRSYDDGSTWYDYNLGINTSYFGTLKYNVQGHMFIMDSSRTIYRSTNDGSSWSKIPTVVPNPTTFCVGLNGELFVGTSYDGFFRSSDVGKHWVSTQQTLPFAEIKSVLANNSGFTLATGFGLHRSKDHGKNWERLKLSEARSEFSGVIQDDQGNIYLFGNGLFISSDKGDTWVRKDLFGEWIYSLAIDRNHIIYACVGYYQHQTYSVYRSTDNGTTWKGAGWSFKDAQKIALNSKGDLYAATYYSGILHSTDQGEHWNTLFQNNWSVISDLIISTNGNIYAAMSDSVDTMIRSTDGGMNWEKIDISILGSYIFAFAINSNDEIFVSSVASVFRSLDNGDTWERIDSGLNKERVTSFTFDEEDGFAYAGTLNGGVFRSTKSTTSMRSESEIPQDIVLYQNHPNPFSSSTSIQFQLQKPTFVTLKIFNAFGQEVQRVIDGQLYDAGVHDVKIELSMKKTELLFYQLITPELIQTKRMIVLR